MRAIHRLLLTATSLTVTLAALGAPLPDLGRLKLAAEAGDAIAQFHYAQRIGSSDKAEQAAWFLRSAEQGFTAAQNAVGASYDKAAVFAEENRVLYVREAVRWTSRAAYQAFPAAQIRLSRYYENGNGVAKDPVLAYMWIHLAIENPSATFGEKMMASMSRDRISAHTTEENVAEGRRLAADFVYPRTSGLNPVESGLLVSELQLTGIFERRGRGSAAVNKVRFSPGDTRNIRVDDHFVQLTCVAVAATSARFRVAGAASDITLTLTR